MKRFFAAFLIVLFCAAPLASCAGFGEAGDAEITDLTTEQIEAGTEVSTKDKKTSEAVMLTFMSYNIEMYGHPDSAKGWNGRDPAKAMETVQALKAAGSDDTSAALQEAEEAAWNAWNSMNDAFDRMNSLRVDALSDELNRLTSAYNNLKSVVTEFEEHGAISLSSFQSILEGGVQYLTFLEKEDGRYKMTEQSLRDYISVRKEQLALETAMQYLANIKQALENGETERVKSLIDATNSLSSSTWSLVYARAAELKELGLTDAQYAELIGNIDKLRELSKDVESDLGAWDKTSDPIEKLADSFDNLNKEIDHYLKHQEQAFTESVSFGNTSSNAWYVLY